MPRLLRDILKNRGRRKLPLNTQSRHLPITRPVPRNVHYAGVPSYTSGSSYYPQQSYHTQGPTSYHPSWFSPSVHWSEYQPYHTDQLSFLQTHPTLLNRIQPHPPYPEVHLPSDGVSMQRRLELLPDDCVNPEDEPTSELFHRPSAEPLALDPDSLPEFSLLLEAYDQLKDVLPEHDPDLLNLTKAMWAHSMNDGPDLDESRQDLFMQQQEIDVPHQEVLKEAIPAWELAEEVIQEQEAVFEGMEEMVREQFLDDHPDLPLLAQTLQRLHTVPETKPTDEWTSHLPPGDPYALTPAEEAAEQFYNQLEASDFSHPEMEMGVDTTAMLWKRDKHTEEVGFDHGLEAMVSPEQQNLFSGSELHEFQPDTSVVDDLWVIDDPHMPGEDMIEDAFSEDLLEDIVQQEAIDKTPIGEEMVSDMGMPEFDYGMEAGVEPALEPGAMGEINQAIDQVIEDEFPDPMQAMYDPMIPDYMIDPYQIDPLGGMYPDPTVMPGPFG
jgi:hypothetical protein